MKQYIKTELKALWSIVRFLIWCSAAWLVVWSLYDAIHWGN